MKSNMGSMDKAVRILLAIAVAVLYFTGRISGIWAIVLGVIAVVFVLTSLVSFCPLYAPFKLSTKGKG